MRKAAGRTFLTTITIALVGFLASVVTARILGPNGRGLLSAALLVGTLSANIAQMGLATSYVYYKGAGRPFDYATYLAFCAAVVVTLAALLACVGTGFNREHELRDQGAWVDLFAALMAGHAFFLTLSQVQSDLHFFNFQRLALVVGNLVVLFPVIFFTKTIDFRGILILQIFVAGLLVLADLIWACHHKVWRQLSADRPVELREVLRYAVSHYGTALLGILLVNFDKVALLNMGTIQEYGYYSIAFNTSRLVGSLQDAVSTALFARFAGKGAHELGEKVRAAFRMTFVPMLTLAVLGIALSHWLIVLVYGKAFSGVVIPFSILLLECVVSGASWTLAQYFNASGRPGLVLARQTVSVLPVFLILPFLPHEGAYIYLAGLMLLAAVLRLVVTLTLYPVMLNEPIPRMIPTAEDCSLAVNLLPRWKST